MQNKSNGDARISGALASLAGLERAIKVGQKQKIDQSVKKILLTHAVIMTYGGLPMIYSGDEIGMLNDYSFINEQSKKEDNRWLHRPKMNWEAAEERNIPGTVESKIFYGLKKLITLRKNTPELADLNNLKLINTDNQHVLIYLRFNQDNRLMVLVNFHPAVQFVSSSVLITHGLNKPQKLKDLYTEKPPKFINNLLRLDGYQFCLLKESTFNKKPQT